MVLTADNSDNLCCVLIAPHGDCEYPVAHKLHDRLQYHNISKYIFIYFLLYLYLK